MPRSLKSMAALLLVLALAGCHTQKAFLICVGEVTRAESKVQPGVYDADETQSPVTAEDRLGVESFSFTLEPDDSADQPALTADQVKIETKKVGGEPGVWLATLVFPSRPVRVVASAPGCEPVVWDFNPETADVEWMIDAGVRTFVLKRQPSTE